MVDILISDLMKNGRVNVPESVKFSFLTACDDENIEVSANGAEYVLI